MSEELKLAKLQHKFDKLVKSLEIFAKNQALLSESSVQDAKINKDMHISQFYLRSAQIYDETGKTVKNILATALEE